MNTIPHTQESEEAIIEQKGLVLTELYSEI